MHQKLHIWRILSIDEIHALEIITSKGKQKRETFQDLCYWFIFVEWFLLTSYSFKVINALFTHVHACAHTITRSMQTQAHFCASRLTFSHVRMLSAIVFWQQYQHQVTFVRILSEKLCRSILLIFSRFLLSYLHSLILSPVILLDQYHFILPIHSWIPL